MKVKISAGNSKMGMIPSVSLPAWLTCKANLPCYKTCYAAKLERLRPSVRNAYQSNYDLLMTEPDTYWKEVEDQIKVSRYFRFHVSGDIPNEAYLYRMIGVAQRNKHCQILCFTKRYDFVNAALEAGMKLPKNLHVVFSGWDGLKMDNPHRLPEAHVKYRDGSTTAKKSAKSCGGNCTVCAQTSGGCWSLKRGEQVVFNEH